MVVHKETEALITALIAVLTPHTMAGVIADIQDRLIVAHPLGRLLLNRTASSLKRQLVAMVGEEQAEHMIHP